MKRQYVKPHTVAIGMIPVALMDQSLPTGGKDDVVVAARRHTFCGFEEDEDTEE